MSDRKGVLPIVLILALLCASVGVYAADFPPSEFRNICRLPEVTASASSVMANTAYTAEKAIDGTSDSNASRWISAVTSPVSAQWLTVDFKESYLLCGARLYSGYYDNANLSSPAVTFRYQYSAGLDGGGKDIWTDIPNASVTNNAEFVRDVVFGEGIVSDKIRLYVTGYTGTDSQVRIRELEVFAPLARQIPLAVSNVTTTGFDLSWDAVEDAAGYEVSVDDAAAVAVANHAYTVSGLNGGVTYSVKVAALDAGGEILGQGKTTVTTVSDLAAPGNLTATPSDTSVSLSWSASAGAAEYLVFRDGAEAGTVAGTSYTDAAVIPQKTYAYQVRARGAGGSLSPYSGEISVTTLAIQPASGLTVSEVTDQSAIVTWTPSPHGAYLSGYVIYRTKLAAAPSGRTMTEVGRVSNAVTDYHDFGMRADTEYTYSVKAYIGTEFSAECAAEPITTLAAPAVNLGYTETVATAYADSNAGPITPYSGTTHAQDFTRNHTGLNAVRLDFGILSGTNLGAQFSCGGNYNISQSVADGTAALTFWQLAVGGSAESVEIVDADSRRVSIPLRGYSQGDYGKWKYMVVPLSGSGPDWTKIRNIVFKKWGNAVPFSMWIDDLKIVKFGAPSAAGLSLCSADGENTGAATAEGGYTASSATRHIRIQYPITIFDQTTLTDDLFTLELFGSGGNGSVPFTGTYDALTNRYTLTLDEQTALAAGKRYTLAIGAGAKLVTGAVDTAGAVFDIYCADFYASGVAYLDGADQPLDITAAATVDYLKARVTFVNDSGGAEHARLALAVYDAASGELTAVEYAAFDDVSVGESVKEVILSGYGGFDVPSAHKIRLFVWGGTDGMQPLTRAEELFTPIQD